MDNKELITETLNSLGFPLVGFLRREDAQLGNWIQNWIEQGFHGEMNWIEKNMEIRRDPCSILEDGRSLISLGIPYLTATPEQWQGKHLISNYAWGEDYHRVIKRKLKDALLLFKEKIPGFKGRAFTDSAPLAEKIIATKSGLGWIGKNSLLINQKYGSYLFLAVIVCNQNLLSTPPVANRCRSCDLCLNACPTTAINDRMEVNSTKCISYLTIEKKDDFEAVEKQGLEYQIFGCDICQQVCPWNRKAPYQENSPFSCFDRWSGLTKDNLSLLLSEEFETLKKKSPIKRAKKEGFQRNIQAVLNQS